MIFFVAVLIIVLIFLYLFYRNKWKKQGHPLLKRVPGHFLLGNANDLKFEVVLDSCVQFSRKYGHFLELYFLHQRILFISDAKICREMLSKRPKKFERLRNLDYSTAVLRSKSALFNASGETWQRIRKSTAPSFSNLNLSHKVAIVAKEIFSWIQQLKAQIPVGQVSSAEIDMKHEAFRVTVRVITVVAFGFPTDHPLVSYFVGPTFHQDVTKQFQFIGASAMFLYPRWTWQYFPSKVKLERDAVEAIERVYAESRKILEYKRDLYQHGLLENNCMVDNFILNAGNASERALTDDEIIVNVRTFYAAGADTTSVAICWATYYLSLYPHYLLRVRQEVTEVLFANQSPEEYFASSGQIDVNTFAQMRFTSAFVKELLRLRSPSINISLNLAREETEPYTFSNGITIYPDDLVYANFEGMHHNEAVFAQPEEFNPNRWLTTDSKQLEVMEANFMPFGAGPRICPGMGLAYQEATLALALLAYSFDFQLNCPPEEIQRIPTFVAVPTKMPIVLSHAK